MLWKLFKIIFLGSALLLVGLYLFSREKPPEKFSYGVSFSQKYAQELGLDWKKTYLAVLDDLGARRLRLMAYWDLIEPEEGNYNFSDLDWQVEEAGKRGAEIILVIGRKLPRWPECHIPSWAKGDREAVLKIIEKVVKRYRDNPAIKYWQVENEPLLGRFGICPKPDPKLLDREVHLVKAFDDRPVIITDSGELSTWWRASRRADIFGTTLYRITWNKYLKYVHYILPPWTYRLRAKIIRKPVMIVELQGEPWGPKSIPEMDLKEQSKSMNIDKFRQVIEYEKKTGIAEVYLWGAEWWYWLKEKHNDRRIWEEAKRLMINIQ
jgi:hypothetical protein